MSESSSAPEAPEKHKTEPVKPKQGKLERPTTELRFVARSVNAFVQWMPLGVSGAAFASFCLQQNWVEAVMMFPATAVTGVWAAYSKNFVEQLQEIYAERGKTDANRLVALLDSANDTAKWLLGGTDEEYLKLVAMICRDYTTEGFHPAGSIPLLVNVFVPLQLSNKISREPDGLMPPMLQKERISIWDLLQDVRRVPAYRKLAILARGGYGKTTLMRHLTYTFAKRHHRKYQVPKLVPFLILLRNYWKVLTQESPPNLPDFITQHYIPNLPQGKTLKLPPNWANNLLRKGGALVMFDGFDAVPDGKREGVSRWISAQMREYDASVFILTSRPRGYYAHYSAERPTCEVWVNTFNKDQRQQFIEDWYRCQERYRLSGRKKAEIELLASRESADLLAQIEQRKELQEIARNPLLLNIIATLHRSFPGTKLPRRQVELYREICLLQLGKRPLARRIELVLPQQESQGILQGLALRMMELNQLALARAEVLEILRADPEVQSNTLNVERFLDQVVLVSELLVEKDTEEVYGFLHFSFQAYLASAQVVRTQQESLLIDHWLEDWWRETILLYAAQVDPSGLLHQAYERHGTRAAPLEYDIMSESLTDLHTRSSPLYVLYLWLALPIQEANSRSRPNIQQTAFTEFLRLLDTLNDGSETEQLDKLTNHRWNPEFQQYPSGLEIANSFAAITQFLQSETPQTIASSPQFLTWYSPQENYIRPTVIQALVNLGNINQEIRLATTASSRINQIAALARANDALQDLHEDVTNQVPPRYPEQKLLHRIIHQWREIITTAAGAIGEAQILSPIANPYIVGPPVRGRLFVGRDDILKRLEELWMQDGQLMSVALYGHRRMGKTSILQNLDGRLGPNTTIIDFNMQRVGIVENVSELLHSLALSLYDSLPENTNLLEPSSDTFAQNNPYTTFDRFLKKLNRHRNGTRYIINIDEFEILENRLIQDKIVAPYLLEYLRSLIVTYPWFILIFAGLASLEEMRQDYWNPLFGNVTGVPVGVLSPAAATELITNPTDDFPLDYNPDAIQAIYRLTGGQPYLIQLICHSLISRFNRQRFEEGQDLEPRLTLADVETIITSPDFYRDGNAYFSGVWSQSQEEYASEQATILQMLSQHPNGLSETELLQTLQARNPASDNTEIASLDQPGSRVSNASHALALLQKHDVIHREQGHYCFVVELMRRWVAQQP